MANSVYKPSVIGIADVFYESKKHGVAFTKSYTLVAPLYEGPVALYWDEAKAIDLDMRDFSNAPIEGMSYTSYPAAAADAGSYDKWQKLFTQYIRTNLKLKLFSSPSLKVVSKVGEDERDFRIRLQHIAHEKRDGALDDLKKKYASKIDTLEDKQIRARQALEKQNAQAGQKKLEAAVSAGTAILGALFGRKSISATSISRVGTAMKSTNRAFNSGQDTAQAEEKLQVIEAQMTELQLELEQQIEVISDSYNVMDEELEEVSINAKGTNITPRLVCLAWMPEDVNVSQG